MPERRSPASSTIAPRKMAAPAKASPHDAQCQLPLGRQDAPEMTTPQRRVLARPPAFDLCKIEHPLYATSQPRGSLRRSCPEGRQDSQDIVSGDLQHFEGSDLRTVSLECHFPLGPVLLILHEPFIESRNLSAHSRMWAPPPRCLLAIGSPLSSTTERA